MSCGIYVIESKSNPEKFYIGSSADIEFRWYRHLYDLKVGVHGNLKLQNHYNKYGVSDLSFSIIIECYIENLIYLEQYYLDLYKPFFNICLVAGSCLGVKRSEDTRIKMRNRWEKYRNGKPISKTYNYKKKGPKIILQFDKDMNLIKEWIGFKDAISELNINGGNISSCIHGKRKTAGDFIWKFKQ